MAAPPRAKRGRPKLPGSLKLIRLRESVFDLWRERKDVLGFINNTDSEFAEYLLHRRTHDVSTNRNENPSLDGNNSVNTAGPLLVSTPIPAQRSLLEIESSNVNVTSCTPTRNSLHTRCQLFECSTTSTTSIEGQDPWQTRCVLFDQSSHCLAGNPYSTTEDNKEDNSEDNSEDESADDNIDLQLSYDYNTFPDVEQSMDAVLQDLNGSDTSSVFSEDSDWSNNCDFGNEEASDITQHLNDESMDISDEDDERTLTMIDPNYGDEDCAEYQGESTTDKSVETNETEVLQKLKDSFKELTCSSNLQTFINLHSRTRVIVSIEKLLELCKQKCLICSSPLDQHHEFKTTGSRVEIIRKCCNGHTKKWVSSEVIGVKNNMEIFLNDSLLAASIIISGNNYSKFSLLCHALGLKIINNSMFLRFQKHCAAPVIQEMWDKMNTATISILQQYEKICLCGDGRNDSPGHSARYCVYTLMEHATKVIVDMSVIDKRETGGNSVTMEKEGLRRLLERIAGVLPLSEITTDASSSIMKLVREMKGKFPQLVELFHSLDIWHKAKKLSKCLHKAAKVKGCEPLKDWVDDVVNHFWFSCQNSEGSDEELKKVWLGVVHHVCGEHIWADGACIHSSEEAVDTNKAYLGKSSKAAAALRTVVMDPKWLKNLGFYVRFRHTSVLESYNSMLTKYAPKRIAFEYPYFIMRIMLAAIDHNMHLARGKKLSAAGNELGHRKYSKRTQKFHAEIVKENKNYSYFPFLMAKMINERCALVGSLGQRTDDNVFDPKQITPTIGMKAPPPTKELMKGPSRLSKPETSSKSTSTSTSTPTSTPTSTSTSTPTSTPTSTSTSTSTITPTSTSTSTPIRTTTTTEPTLTSGVP